MSSPAEINIHGNAGCEICGSFETVEFTGKFLCADCIALAGCGCMGHGSGDET